VSSFFLVCLTGNVYRGGLDGRGEEAGLGRCGGGHARPPAAVPPPAGRLGLGMMLEGEGRGREDNGADYRWSARTVSVETGQGGGERERGLPAPPPPCSAS
jgi:hypothetical protein